MKALAGFLGTVLFSAFVLALLLGAIAIYVLARDAGWSVWMSLGGAFVAVLVPALCYVFLPRPWDKE